MNSTDVLKLQPSLTTASCPPGTLETVPFFTGTPETVPFFTGAVPRSLTKKKKRKNEEEKKTKKTQMKKIYIMSRYNMVMLEA